ncbi:MAG: hypothetical protein ACTSW3_03080 [Promethearchaeota archaeon]
MSSKNIMGLIKESAFSNEIIPINETQLNQSNIPAKKRDSIYNGIEECEKAKREYFAIINDIHFLLTNNKELTQEEKLVYCNKERYFMKLYLKEVLTKLKNIFLD